MAFLVNEGDYQTEFSNLSDEAVLEASIGSPDAFEVIVDRYQEAFIRKLKMMIQTSSEVEDIVQDAFVKIYVNAHKFHPVPGASFKSWAYKILLNTAFTKFKKLGLEKARNLDLDPEIVEALPDRTDGWSKYLDLDEFLVVVSRLPVQAGRILKAVAIEGKTSEDLAKDEGISVTAVRTRLHRAKKEFKRVSETLV